MVLWVPRRNESMFSPASDATTGSPKLSEFNESPITSAIAPMSNIRSDLVAPRNLLKKRLAAATIVLLAFAVGLWAGWHKDAISARLLRWHSELTRTIPSPSPSSSPLTLTESSVEAMAQTPAPWPSLVDQLKREGIELRDRGDTTNAIERLQEALDSESNNAAVTSRTSEDLRSHAALRPRE